MTERVADSSPRLKARTAGLLYLINLIMNGIAIFVLLKLTVPGGAAATAHNILASEQLFRYGFAADLVGALCYIGVTLLLYKLFKAVSETFSLLAAFLSLVAVAIAGANLVNLMAPLVLLGGAPYLHAIAPGQLQALALTFLRLHGVGYLTSVVFFSFYMIVIGGLIVRSTFMPRIIGVLLIIESVCALIYCFASFLAPPFAAHLFPAILAPGLIGEGSLTLWLLIVGVNAKKWKEQAAATS
ncbi:MAG TPA: DUF4386 domain-containing protein [Rhizomicrobium sp.]